MTTLPNKNLIIRSDADTKIGTGHVMRCIALAQAWQEQGGNVTFLSYCDSEALRQRIIDEGFDFIPIENPHPDLSDLTQTLNILKRHALCSMPHALWLVLDGYHFTPDYQKAIRENAYKLLVIDDMAHLDHYHADILLNQNIHASSLPYSCDMDTVKLLGCEYVMLRREFLNYKNWKREIPEKANRILVTLGGSDPDNVTLKVINALNSLNAPALEVKVVAGPSNPNVASLKEAVHRSPFTVRLLSSVDNMAELMALADIAISASGSTCWEMAFMGLPTVLIVTGDNQKGVAAGLDEIGVATRLGWFSEISPMNIAKSLSSMCKDNGIRKEMSQRENKLVDGDGSLKIINAMKDVANKSLFTDMEIS